MMPARISPTTTGSQRRQATRGLQQGCGDFATALRWKVRGTQSCTALTPYPSIQMGTSVYIGDIGDIGYIGYSVDRPGFGLVLATHHTIT